LNEVREEKRFYS